MSEENQKISPGQCHCLGGQMSDRIFKSDADFERSQEVLESQNHPFWPAFDALVKKFLVAVEAAKETIIEWLGDLVIPAQGPFEIAKHFNKTKPGGVKFWDFGPNFVARFGSMTEKEVGETTVALGKLRVKAKFAEMTPELGTRHIVTGSQIYWMLSQQPNGEKPNGKNRRLAVDGSATLLRAIDVNGIECAVFVFWFGGRGWYVNARDLEYESQWRAGDQVVSSKCVFGT